MTVYRPAEDSLLLKNYLSELDLEGLQLLDMGTGSGILTVEMAGKGAEVSAADINPEALKKAEEKAEEQGLEIQTIETDLFERIDQEFDMIVFNPPYLPGNEGPGDEEIWRGGEKGTEVLERFLHDIDNYLKDEGYALFLISSRSENEELVRRYDLQIIRSKKIWFEELKIARYR